ncbi:hypothetical protein [Parabacteroides sp. FAFU027]|uniref:hypothetical protein n=1 Tax=Parabacteroides sp. FAFU027 TaxID=2922715 RepID=UPI001FAF3731|nr:hypothetical protein [Parabacteroides sp. FAFU027]
MRIKEVILLIIISIGIISCTKISPAAFWLNYKKDFIVKELNNQGPWGGYRIIHWKIKGNEAFEKSDIFNYAKDNGWILIDSCSYNTKLPNSWSFLGKAIFPFNYNKSNNADNQINDKLPRYIYSDFDLYSFRTGWLLVEPGTDESIEKTGFILFSKSRQEMTIYHLWGE